MSEETSSPPFSTPTSSVRTARVGDPEFRYPESKNPYQQKILEAPGLPIFCGHDSEAHAGRWREQFSGFRPKELRVEIGCNGGHVALGWAERQPEIGFIGIDWKFKQIYRGAEKARDRNLKNLLFFRAHADRLKYMFGKGEIDRLHLFFPDPWPRKSQWRNRWVKAANLRAAAEVVRKGGAFEIKTDHDAYFEWMKEAFQEVSDIWKIESITHDLHADVPDPRTLQIPDVTLFERIFIRDGIRIKRAVLRRI